MRTIWYIWQWNIVLMMRYQACGEIDLFLFYNLVTKVKMLHEKTGTYVASGGGGLNQPYNQPFAKLGLKISQSMLFKVRSFRSNNNQGPKKLCIKFHYLSSEVLNGRGFFFKIREGGFIHLNTYAISNQRNNMLFVVCTVVKTSNRAVAVRSDSSE